MVYIFSATYGPLLSGSDVQLNVCNICSVVGELFVYYFNGFGFEFLTYENIIYLLIGTNSGFVGKVIAF